MRITPSHSVPRPSLFPSRAPARAPAPRIVPARSDHPVLLYDTVTVESGGEQQFRSEAFTNNLGQPIDLHALRVSTSPLAGASNAVFGSGLIALSISIDGIPMTRGPVPVWSFCRSDNRRDDQFTNGTTTNEVWYFPFPLTLMPGKTINIHAKHLGVVTQSVIVGVSLPGRLSDGGGRRRIPYAASWSTASFAYNEARTDSIPPAMLANGTKRDLHISRIIGRSVAFNNEGASPALRDWGDRSLQGISSLSVRLGVSLQQPILRTYTPWRAVFGHNAALETDFILRPGDFISGDIQHVAGPALGTAFTYSQNRGEISIVGWRDA